MEKNTDLPSKTEFEGALARVEIALPKAKALLPWHELLWQPGTLAMCRSTPSPGRKSCCFEPSCPEGWDIFHLLVAWVRNAECSGVAPSVSLVKLVCLSIELWLHLAARGRARLEQDSYFNCRWA